MSTYFFKNFLYSWIALVLLSVPSFAGAAVHVVLIDPAHGGEDSGVKISRSLYEKDIALSIAKLVEKNLSAAVDVPVEVHLTRSDDKTLSFEERKKIFESASADIFISIHINAGFAQKAEGYEIYYLGGETPSDQEEGSAEIIKDMEQTRRINNSVLLAQTVQREMGAVFLRQGRGLRSAPVQILQPLEIPAILLEIGFSTSVDDRKKIKDEEIQKAVADALVMSIKKYISIGGAS